METTPSSMEAAQAQIRRGQGWVEEAKADETMTLLSMETDIDYDQHGQGIITAAMWACKDVISVDSIPAFRRCTDKILVPCLLSLGHFVERHGYKFLSRCMFLELQIMIVFYDSLWTELFFVLIACAGSIPGVTKDQMKLQIKLGVSRPTPLSAEHASRFR